MANTDYYVRAEGLLNTTSCVIKSIVVNSLTMLPTSITAQSATINIGTLDTLGITGGSLGTGASWNWFTNGCGVTPAGTGAVLPIAPTVTTMYYVNGIGTCNTTLCDSLQIVVIPGYTVSGLLLYDVNGTPLDSVKLFLNNSNGTPIDSSLTDLTGAYHFNVVPTGTYTFTGKSYKPWGGVNSSDAVKVKRHFAGSEYFTTSLRMHAADVNLSYGINVTDAVKITRRFVGTDTIFTRPDWIFEKPLGGDTLNVSVGMNDTIVVNGANIVQDIKGVAAGDVNGSYLPPAGAFLPVGAKQQPKVELNYSEVKRLNSGQYFELPINVTNNMRLGAISLILNYPKGMMEILDVKLKVNNELQDLYYNIVGNELRIGWFETKGSISLQNNEALLVLSIRTLNTFKAGDNIRMKVSNSSLCELADEDGDPIENVILNTYSIEHVNTMNISGASELENDIIVYPNPAKDIAKINYNIVGDGFVKISLYNLLGEKVADIVNQAQLKGSYRTEMDLSTLPAGIYTCKMVLDDHTTIMKRVAVSK